MKHTYPDNVMDCICDNLFAFFRCLFHTGVPWSVMAFLLEENWLLYVSLVLNILCWFNVISLLRSLHTDKSFFIQPKSHIILVAATNLFSSMLIFIFWPFFQA